MKITKALFTLLLTYGTHTMTNNHSSHTLIDVKSLIPTIAIDLQYATDNNFVHQKVYNFTTCYLLDIVVEKLALVQKDLAAHGLGLKIWDGYRPAYAQEKFWEMLPDENYVVHPSKGSRHTCGVAVDVTLINLATGEELEMPSGFDDFSQKAHIDYTDTSKVAIENRTLLINAMEKHGFVVWKYEWWHFNLCGWQDFPVLDFVPKK